MNRITISLPDQTAAALEREARRRHAPVSRIVREAIEAHLKPAGRRKLPFASLGKSGHRSTSEDVDEILAAEWDRAERPGA